MGISCLPTTAVVLRPSEVVDCATAIFLMLSSVFRSRSRAPCPSTESWSSVRGMGSCMRRPPCYRRQTRTVGGTSEVYRAACLTQSPVVRSRRRVPRCLVTQSPQSSLCPCPPPPRRRHHHHHGLHLCLAASLTLLSVLGYSPCLPTVLHSSSS